MNIKTAIPRRSPASVNSLSSAAATTLGVIEMKIYAT